MKNASAPRYDWIDANKGLAIIIVVLYHVTIGLQASGMLVHDDILQYTWLAMTALATPVFFVMSGYFIEKSLAKGGVKKFLATSAQYILYPYFLWAILQLAIKILFAQFVNTPVEEINFVTLLTAPPAQFWFLHALFLAQVMFILFYMLVNKHHLLVACAALLISWNVVEFSVIADAIRSFGFLLVGTWMAKKKDLADTITPLPVIALALMGYVLSLVLYKEVMAPEGFDGVTNFVGGIAITFVASGLFIRYGAPKWFAFFGRYSMYIFVMHLLCLVPVRVAYKMLGVDAVPLLILACTLAGIVLPVIAAMVIEFLGIERYLGIKRVSTSQAMVWNNKMQLQVKNG